MRLKPARALAGSCVPVAILLSLAGCGGGGSFSTGGTPPPPQPAEFLFAEGNQQQVAVFSVDAATGALTQTDIVEGNHGGLGIAANPVGTFLYTDDVAADGIDGFSIGSGGTLSAVSGSPFPMPSGWTAALVDALAVDPSGKFLYAPDSPADAVVGFTIGANGTLTPIQGSPFQCGLGPEQVVVHPSGKFLYVSDYNDPQGSISAFTVDSSTGALTAVANSPFPTAPGGAPDGLVTDPSGKFLYAALPYLNSVAAFTINSSTGALTPVAGSPFTPHLTDFPVVYSVAVTPSGAFLYALGAQDGKIYAFSIDSSSGALAPLSGSPFNIELVVYMSGLTVDPSGKFLYVGDETGSIILMSIDGTTGALAVVQQSGAYAYGPGLTVIKVP